MSAVSAVGSHPLVGVGPYCHPFLGAPTVHVSSVKIQSAIYV